MANSARNAPGTTPAVPEETVVYEDSNALETVQVFYEKRKKTISTVTTAILVVVVGYFGYMKMYKEPNDEKAAAAMYWPSLYFQADSLNLALNGDGKNLGFSKLSSKYSGTPAGNIAHYYEGVCYLKMGDFPKAIKALESFDGKGTTLGHQAQGALGMAYMESGNSAKAIENFKKATENKEDGLVTPLYLYHLGLAYQAAGQANEAKEAFKRIKNEYPRSLQAKDMDKELAKMGELN